MAQFLKIKSEGGGASYSLSNPIEFLINISDFVGFTDQFSVNSTVLGFNNIFSESNKAPTSLALEIADSTGVDTKPARVLEQAIINALTNKPGGVVVDLVLPENYSVKSYELLGFVV
tara:strand:+ start:608 stop:958 length:351 start_codon:yes stop_codon:yes gene_type:complete